MILAYAAAGILGLIAGSFINVLIYMLREEKSIKALPSVCAKCGAKLRPVDLIPVFSCLFPRGRCKYCGTALYRGNLAVGLLTGAVYILLFDRFGLSAAFVAFAYLMLILIAVAFIDYDKRIIPDELVIAGIAGGAVVFVYNIFRPGELVYGDASWWNPLLGFFAASGILFVMAVLGGLIFGTDDAIGMGDVKLLAPIGLFLGWKLVMAALCFSVLAAGIASLILIIFRLRGRKDMIPLGPFIVAGTFAVVMWGWDIIHWYIDL